MFWARPGYAAGHEAGRQDRAAERDLDTARHLSRALFGVPRPAPVVYSEEVVQRLNAELERVRRIAQQNHDAWQQAVQQAAANRSALDAAERRCARLEADAQDLEDALVETLKAQGITLPSEEARLRRLRRRRDGSKLASRHRIG